MHAWQSVDSLRRDVHIIAFVELLQLTRKKDVGMGLCMFNFVFYAATHAFAYCHAYIHLFEYLLAYSSLHTFGNAFVWLVSVIFLDQYQCRCTINTSENEQFHSLDNFQF